MKNRLPAFLLLFACFEVSAQLGITVSPTSCRAREWQVVVENYVTHRRVDFLRHGTTAVVDYALPLRSEAWRLQPAVHAMLATFGDFKVTSIGIQGNASFSPFPPPDPHKRPLVPGRIFFQLSPGLDLVRKSLSAGEPKSQRVGDASLAFNIGGSVLLEFQLSEFLTVSPVAGVRFYPNLKWEDFTETVSQGQMRGTFDRTTWRHFTLGLRMGLRLGKTEG